MNSHRNGNFRSSFRWLTIALFTLLSVLFLRSDTDNFYLLFDLIRNVIDQLLRIIPSKTRIRDGFSINMLADLLAARL